MLLPDAVNPVGVSRFQVTRETNKLIKLLIVITAASAFAALAACSKSKPTTNRASQPQNASTPESTPSSTPGMTPVESVVIERNSPFNHNTKAHKQDCSACHRRVDNGPVPKFPDHSACNDCHQKDFTTTSSQMCAVCHQTPLDQQPRLIAFPTRLAEFGIRGFSHQAHLDPTKMPAGTQPLKCENCHRTGSGSQVSFPRHPECYDCHTHQAGEKLAECGTCHAAVSEAMKYRTGSTGAFALYNFKHSSHITRVSCDRCHRSVPMTTVSRQSDILKISTARGQRHRSACWSCHVQARESVCTKCHVSGVPMGR